MSHKPVLLNEVIESLQVKDNEVFVDLTLGNAGHTKAIIDTGVKNLTVVGIDADEQATMTAEKVLQEYKDHNIIITTTYFDSLPEVLEENNISKINKVLIDLGFRSDQVDQPERGFSFKDDGPLLMTFQSGKDLDENTLTAYEIVNKWEEESIADIIFGFGEETFSRAIAKKIVKVREDKPIETTQELADIVKRATPFFYRHGKIHPATKTFQAIRIAVNSELDRLEKVLPYLFENLESGGRISIISFHSLEDRIVKRYFRKKSDEGLANLINKRPITATEEELAENNRARSAKLRTLEKI